MGFLLPLRSKLVLLLLVHVVVARFVSSFQPNSCHDEERSALLQFKQSLTIDRSASGVHGAYPKVSSWKPAHNGDNNSCCSWDGVQCDEKTGHVIGLDLSSSCLYGSINSSSSLFHLVHLQSLNLFDNDFNHSHILPSTIMNFPRLRYLNLSYSVFSGQIPTSFANLTLLEYLSLSENNFNGPIPASLANLAQLEYLSLSFNDQISSGSLSWVGKQTKLNELRLDCIALNGPIPSSLANLTQLEYLSLSFNNFNGPIPAFLANLTQLEYLLLSYNNFNGPIPASLANLTQLKYIYLSANELTGDVPSWLGNLTGLVGINLNQNNLSGSIPDSLFNLKNVEELSLGENSFTGVVDIFKVQRVTKVFQIGNQNLEVLFIESKTKNATTLPQFSVLSLFSCNIKEFPDFLRYQQNLNVLELVDNKLHGQVPKWMWNTSTQSLNLLDLRYNFLSSFGQPTVVLPWVNLQVLFLDGNLIQGSLPIPPQSITYYSVRNNKFAGELSSSFCNQSTLQYLDLRNNKLSGNIPQCLGNSSGDLQAFALGNNLFHGILPQTFSKTVKLIDVSYNNLEGKLPRSLANCMRLQSLVLSNNVFSDDFPIWLGNLPELKLLALNHNQLYGVIESTNKHLYFPELRILDLSYNNFKGEFPSEYIFLGISMRGGNIRRPTYMVAGSRLNFTSTLFFFMFSVTISNKGVQRYYERIQEDLVVIDISSNQFQGNIPEFIGKLNGLRFLNISHNRFTGLIPSLLGNLTLLEYLDLSQNQLSGEIPQQLAQLTSLAFFNVSYNNITGSIPNGPQFQTFESTSFEGNPELCGDQLLKKCLKPKVPYDMPTSGMGENDSGSGIEFDWKFILAGIVSGLLVGVVLADVAITRRPELFLEIVGMLIRTMKRIKMRNMLGHNN